MFEALEHFLIKFNYHKKLIEEFPQIKTVNLNKRHNKTKIKFILTVAQDRGEYLEVARREDINRPIMKHYCFYNKSSKDIINKFIQYPEELSIYRWYEFELPSILKKLNISFKRTEIQSKRIRANGKKETTLIAAAWEITTDRKELQKMYKIIF